MLTVASCSSTRKAPMIFLRPAYMTGTKLMLELAEDLERLLLRIVEVCIPDPCPEVVQALEDLADVTVRMRGDECVARCLCLHDPGSTLNVSTTAFLTAIRADVVQDGDTHIRTVSGRTNAKNVYKLQLMACGYHHNLGVVMMDGFSPATGLTCLELGLLEMLLGLDKSITQNIQLPDKTKDCHILIGNAEGNLDILRIWDPRSLGLKHLYFSRDIKLYYCHFAVDKKVIVSGRFGTPDILCGGEKINFPGSWSRWGSATRPCGI